MGLGFVELVMMIEERFEIPIPDDDLAAIETVGELHAYLMKRLERRAATPSAEAVFATLRSLIAEASGVEECDIHAGSHFIRDLDMG